YGRFIEVFSKMDKNKDAFISWGETVTYLKRRHAELIQERAYDAFNSVDTNQNGLLYFWETKTALERLGKDTTSPFLRHMFAAADRDKDMQIDFQEFSVLMSELSSLKYK
ncbi:hypothetical protein GE061_006635, partial [Apolygus lucorum]